MCKKVRSILAAANKALRKERELTRSRQFRSSGVTLIVDKHFDIVLDAAGVTHHVENKQLFDIVLTRREADGTLSTFLWPSEISVFLAGWDYQFVEGVGTLTQKELAVFSDIELAAHEARAAQIKCRSAEMGRALSFSTRKERDQENTHSLFDSEMF